MGSSVSTQQDSSLRARKCLFALAAGQNIHSLYTRAIDGLPGKAAVGCSHMKSDMQPRKCSAGGVVR